MHQIMLKVLQTYTLFEKCFVGELASIYLVFIYRNNWLTYQLFHDKQNTNIKIEGVRLKTTLVFLWFNFFESLFWNYNFLRVLFNSFTQTILLSRLRRTVFEKKCFKTLIFFIYCVIFIVSAMLLTTNIQIDPLMAPFYVAMPMDDLVFKIWNRSYSKMVHFAVW